MQNIRYLIGFQAVYLSIRVRAITIKYLVGFQAVYLSIRLKVITDWISGCLPVSQFNIVYVTPIGEQKEEKHILRVLHS